MLDRWLLLDWKRFFLIVVAWASAVILHNLIYALFVDYFGPEGDEAIFFILAVIVIPAYFVLALAYTAIRKYGGVAQAEQYDGSWKRRELVNTQTEAVMGMIAALLVLFSAMIDPWISVVLSLLLLVAFSVYRFLGMRQSR